MKKKDFLTNTIIAHRGIHHTFLENTLLAFEEAIKNHYTIELDVRLTKDREIIVFHDSNLKRIFDINRDINDLTLEEIKKYKYIPTFLEVLQLVNGKVPIIIELKIDNRYFVLERKLVELLDCYKGEFSVQSFHPLTLWWFRLNRSHYIRGYLVHNILFSNFFLRIFLNQKLLKKILKPDYIGVNLIGLKENYIQKLRYKYLVIGYTINSNYEYLEYKGLADNFIFNIEKQETVPLRTVSQKE